VGLGSLVIAKDLASVAYRVLDRRFHGRDHGLLPTAVEEILGQYQLANLGRWVWDAMKAKADRMFQPNLGRTGDDLHVGTYLLEKLGAAQAQRPGLVADIVAHSAGAIAVCHLLNAAARHGVTLRNVIFLAPACTVELFHERAVLPFGRFQRFTMFALRDDRERADAIVPYLYPRSLLYFVSGALEGEADLPLLGMERHIRGTAPYDSSKLVDTARFLANPGRVVWAGDAPVDCLSSRARAHGEFDDDSTTLASVKAIIAR
jgi:hypothetical protein